MQVQDTWRKKEEAVTPASTFSLNRILRIFWRCVNPLSHVPVLFTYTDRMKAQIDEKSTTEISLYTHSFAKGLFKNNFWLTPLNNSWLVHLNWNTFITYRDLLHLHVVPHITNTHCASFQHCLRRRGKLS